MVILSGVYSLESSNPPSWRNGRILITRTAVNSFSGGMSIASRAEGGQTCSNLKFSQSQSTENEGICTDYPQFKCNVSCGQNVEFPAYITNSSEACCSCRGGSVPGHIYDWLRVLYAEGGWQRNRIGIADFGLRSWSNSSMPGFQWGLYGNPPPCCLASARPGQFCPGCVNVSDRMQLTKDYLKANYVSKIKKVSMSGSVLSDDTFGTGGESDVETCFACCYLAQEASLAISANIYVEESKCGWVQVSGSELHSSAMGIYVPVNESRDPKKRLVYQQYEGGYYIFFSPRVCTHGPPICNESGPGNFVESSLFHHYKAAIYLLQIS